MRHPASTRDAAGRLFAAGVTRAEVARRLGIARSTSSDWYARWAQDALQDERRAGRRSRLSRSQLRTLGTSLLHPPDKHGLPGAHWTLDAIVLLIERKTGKRYHRGHVARLVKRMGWTAAPLPRHGSAARLLVPANTQAGPVLFQVSGTPSVRAVTRS